MGEIFFDHHGHSRTLGSPERLASLLGAEQATIFSSHAAANFQLIFTSYLDFIRENGRTHIHAPVGEHSSIIDPILRLEKLDVRGKLLPLNSQGQLTAEILAEHLKPRSGLLALSWANDLTGVIQPIGDLAALCKEKGVRLHVDGTSAMGKLYFRFADLNVDSFLADRCLLTSGNWTLLEEPPTHATVMALQDSFSEALEKIDHVCLETARLRGRLEANLASGLPDMHQFFAEVDRLPNYSVLAFPGVHHEMLLQRLRRAGLFATAGEGRLATILKQCGISSDLALSAISFALSPQTNEEEVDRASELIIQTVKRLQRPSMSIEEARSKGMRLAMGSAKEGDLSLTVHLLIDESDGVVADGKITVFGPLLLEALGSAACRIMLRKPYDWARRLSADLLEKEIKNAPPNWINLVLEAFELAAQECMDIPILEVTLAPEMMNPLLEETGEYPGWQELTAIQKKQIIAEVIARDIQPYVQLDAGGVEIEKLEGDEVHIAYSGSCTSCHSATGATLDAIQNILRAKIYPNLRVIPIL